MKLIDSSEYYGCANEVKKCNIIAKRRNHLLERKNNTRRKVLAASRAIEKAKRIISTLWKRMGKLELEDKDVIKDWNTAYGHLIQKAKGVRHERQRKENERIITKLNL